MYVHNNRVICELGRETWGIELGEISDVDIHDNYFENCNRGVMIDEAVSNIRIFRNVFYSFMNGEGTGCALYAFESYAASNVLFANNVVDSVDFAGVNSGLDVRLTYLGSAPDMGIFEYGHPVSRKRVESRQQGFASRVSQENARTYLLNGKQSKISRKHPRQLF